MSAQEIFGKVGSAIGFCMGGLIMLVIDIVGGIAVAAPIYGLLQGAGLVGPEAFTLILLPAIAMIFVLHLRSLMQPVPEPKPDVPPTPRSPGPTARFLENTLIAIAAVVAGVVSGIVHLIGIVIGLALIVLVVGGVLGLLVFGLKQIF